MRTWLVAIGSFSMLGQVVLLRELSVAFYGSELIVVLALGVWMVGTAAGAGAALWSPSPAGVRALLIVLGVLTPSAMVVARGLRPLLSDVPGEYLSFPTQLAAMAAVLAPVAVLLGLSFQWTARLYARTGRTVAAAYAVESAGGLAGGALATLLLSAGVPNFATGIAGCFGLCVAASWPWRGRPAWLVWAAFPIAALLALALIFSAALDRRLTALNHPHLVASVDTGYGRVTLSAMGDQVVVFENDALAYDSQSTSAEELVHLAAVQRPAVRRVLVLEGGTSGLVAAALQHRPDAIDVVELNGALVALARAHLPDHALDAQPVRVHVADPRAFLRRSSARYDLILIGAPEPASGLSNRYYTREMFALARAQLTDDGLLAFRLPASDNVLGVHHRRRLASIHAALRAELSDSVILPGSAHLVLASPAPLSRDPTELAARFDERQLNARLVSAPYIRYLYENDRFAALAAAVADTEAPENRDLRPVCYRHTLMIWLSKFYPALALLDLDPARVPAFVWTVAAIILSATLILLRRRPRARVVTRVALAGFVGMAVETVVILAYQSSRGALFGDLGLLLTAFMAGLLTAAAAVSRWRRLPGWLSIALAFSLASVALGAALALTVAELDLVLATILLFLCGGAVAAVFAHATRVARDQERAVAPLYAADLAGGALASVVASLVLVPWLGLFGTALFAAACGLGAVVEA